MRLLTDSNFVAFRDYTECDSKFSQEAGSKRLKSTETKSVKSF